MCGRNILWCFKICTYTVFYFYCSLWINAWDISSSGRLELAELHACLCHYLLGTCSRSGSPALSRSFKLTKAVHNTSLLRQTALKLSCSVIQDNPEKKENVKHHNWSWNEGICTWHYNQQIFKNLTNYLWTTTFASKQTENNGINRSKLKPTFHYLRQKHEFFATDTLLFSRHKCTLITQAPRSVRLPTFITRRFQIANLILLLLWIATLLFYFFAWILRFKLIWLNRHLEPLSPQIKRSEMRNGSNQVTSQAQTALRAYQDGGPREVRTSLRAIFRCRKNFVWVSRILFYAKYLLFSIFRAFSAIFTLRVEDPFKLENLLQWSLFTIIYNRSTNMNYFI